MWYKTTATPRIETSLENILLLELTIVEEGLSEDSYVQNLVHLIV